MQQGSDTAAAFLSGHGIRPSFQRIRVFEYLCGSKSHPPIDEIYKALAGEIPTLSKTTVYNTLSLFIEHGIARQVVIDGAEARYDADLSPHGHFQCRVCGAVSDFDADVAGLRTAGLEGCCVLEKEVNFRGVCKKCLETAAAAGR